MNEQDYLAAIEGAEKRYLEAQKNLAKAKRAWTEAETLVINTRLQMEKLREQLRVFKLSDPNVPIELREQEIERFREANPDLVEWAKQRDLGKTGE